MRVGMYYNNKDVRVEELPRPKIGKGEVLMRIRASGICGTDVLEWYRIDKVPLVLGHEVAGEICEVGPGVTQYKVGDRICAAHHVPCEECHFCKSGHPTVCETLRKRRFDPGGFAEFVRLPRMNVEKGIFLLPDEISFEEATFIEPLACVLRGQRIAGIRQGDTVLVIGSGMSGLLHIQLAKVLGAKKVIATDIVKFRLDFAERLGADEVFFSGEEIPSKLRRVNDGRLADLVILCTGATDALYQTLQTVERGGTILFFAATGKDVTLQLPVNNMFWRNEITFTSSYAGSPADHITALELIRTRQVRVKEMITHRLPLEKIALGFKLVAEAKDSIKVIIYP